MKRFFLLVSAVLAMTFMANAQVNIDFETGDFSQFDFNNTSSYPWTVVAADNGTSYCMSSSNAGISSSTSSIEATYTFSAAGYVSFDAKCMGEGTSTIWDKCEFYIDNVMQFQYGANLPGWNGYLYEVAAGEHTFVWSYSKDSSVNPTGDAMMVDNVIFNVGSPCVAPTGVTVAATPSSATVTWNGYADTFTLRYQEDGATDWTTVSNIADNTYTIENLAAGDYTVGVQADCAAGDWAEEEFTIVSVESTANWYCYAAYDEGQVGVSSDYISFSVQNPANVSIASNEIPKTFAATYHDGYVWFINYNDKCLCKAALDNEMQVIGSYITVSSAVSSATPTEMSYNPVDGKLYFVASGDNGSTVSSINIANPSEITTIGTLDAHIFGFAINSNGEAYGVNADGFYSVSLTDASMTLIGQHGMSVAYVQTMAFDTETGELFWAKYSSDGNGLYMINTATGAMTYIGQIANGMEATGLFMAVGSTVSTTISDISASFTAPKYNQNPNFEVTLPLGAHYAVEEVNWYCNGEPMAAADVFDNEDADYYMSVLFSAEEDFEFAEDATVYFNGNTALCDTENSGVDDNGNYYAQTVAFHVANLNVYDFEDGTMQGWISVDADGDGYAWEMGSNPVSYLANGATCYAHESTDCVTSGSYSNLNGVLYPDNYLVSPSRDYYRMISFWACAQDASYPAEHFGVAVATVENPSASDFTTIQEWTMTAKGAGKKGIGRNGETRDQGNWYEFTADLSEYEGQMIWVAIRHFNCSDQFLLNVDDIGVAIGYDAIVENDVNALTIYPNPASEKVVFTSEAKVNMYNIYDVTGAMVMSNEVNAETFEVNVEELPAGIYVIRIYGEGLIQTKKFVVE